MTKRLFGVALSVLALLGATAPIVSAEHSMDNVRMAVYRNVSGAALTSGTAVIFDTTDADVTAGNTKSAASTVGILVDTTTTDDSGLFAGVLYDDSCADDQACRFVIYGPTIVRFAGSTDGTTTEGDELGTTARAGELGAGAGAGRLLHNVGVAGSDIAANNSLVWAFINQEAD